MSRYIRLLLILATMAAATCRHAAAGPTGSFIQLSRAATERRRERVDDDMQQMQKIGIHSLIVQWCAEPGIALHGWRHCPTPERFRHD